MGGDGGLNMLLIDCGDYQSQVAMTGVGGRQGLSGGLNDCNR